MVREKFKVALRDMHESLGDRGTVETIREMLKNGELSVYDFSLRELWETFERDEQGYVRPVTEAVSSDMFPQITGELISSTIIKGYDNTNTIGQNLATTVPSKMEIETVAGFDAVEMPEEVQQGREYNDSTMGEKYATIPHTKYGRILSITEEMIYFDKTGQIITRAMGIGNKAALYKERLVVEGVQDVNSNVFRPSGVATAFYRTAVSGDRKINQVAASFGEAGMTSVFKLMHNMVDENGDYVLIDPARLYGLFPFDLWVQAIQMQKSTLVPEGNENATNVWKGSYTPLTSPYITAQSASTWYMGDFMTDFWWSEIWPLQTFSAKPGHEAEFRKDIKSMHKVRFYGQIGAIDDKHCFKAT